MSFVVAGERLEAPGLRSFSFLDDAALRAGPEDLRRRKTRWIRSVILHTTIGEGPNRSGEIPVHEETRAGLARRTANSWRSDRSRCASAHIAVDGDGAVYCLADLQAEAAYHAAGINEYSIGVEICQEHDTRAISRAQLASVVLLCDWLSRRFGIQRQIHWPYVGPVKRLERGGDCVGFFGHRDQTRRRGRGDPGDVVLQALLAARYEGFDLTRGKDVTAWRMRQLRLPGLVADGVPGPATVAALAAAGNKHGMWVSRPGDDVSG